MNNQIWIDADSCPVLVREHVAKMGSRLSLKVIFVANKKIPNNTSFPVEMIVCNDSKDAADNYIFENAGEKDLVITRDIVFADRLVSKGIACINDRGTIFNKENIKSLLADRDFDLQLVEMGLSKHYKEGYDKKKFAAFANSFDKVIFNLIRN
ncbi:MAG: DUF188 domain-containing protein [Treponema sp.]|nr:DUF188 domain-containing protein [Treponema sp.]